MRHAAWARRAGSFATRFVVAVLLTGLMTAGLQSVLADQLAIRAMEQEAVNRVVEIAGTLQEQAALEAAVLELTTERGVESATVVEAPPGGATTISTAVLGGQTVLVVTVPVRLRSGDAGLQVALDAQDARTRSAALRHSLLWVFGLGAACAVPLVLLLGGRRLLRRHRDEVHLSGTDDLTGTGSRRAFPVDLQALVTAAGSDDQPLSVVVAQVSGLEAVLSTLGRRRSEAIFTEVAELLQEHHPHRVYRLGGDVFGVILPAIGPDDAFLLADALRGEVGDRLPPLALTVGVAGLDERCTDAETLLIAADAALDEARQLGGNRVVGPGDAAFGLRWLASRPRD